MRLHGKMRVLCAEKAIATPDLFRHPWMPEQARHGEYEQHHITTPPQGGVWLREAPL